MHNTRILKRRQVVTDTLVAVVAVALLFAAILYA